MNDQIYVKTIEIAGFASALKAMRLPMKSEEKSDSIFSNDVSSISVKDTNIFHSWQTINDISLGTKDIQLLQKLILAGDEHAKVMRGIVVWAELNLPRYIWQELDTYSIGVLPLCSESTMHCEAKGLSDEELEKFKANLKEGHIQKRIRAFTYQTLRRIYFQRRNHRLPTWRNVIIPWIESLPLAKDLITLEKEK